MTGERFYQFTAAEFEEWARDHGFTEGEPFKSAANPRGERVFEKQLSERHKIVIYPSLDVGVAQAREYGAQHGRARVSIRVVGLFLGRDGKYHPGKECHRRLFRTLNWRDNLAAAVREIGDTLAGPPRVATREEQPAPPARPQPASLRSTPVPQIDQPCPPRGRGRPPRPETIVERGLESSKPHDIIVWEVRCIHPDLTVGQVMAMISAAAGGETERPALPVLPPPVFPPEPAPIVPKPAVVAPRTASAANREAVRAAVLRYWIGGHPQIRAMKLLTNAARVNPMQFGTRDPDDVFAIARAIFNEIYAYEPADLDAWAEADGDPVWPHTVPPSAQPAPPERALELPRAVEKPKLVPAPVVAPGPVPAAVVKATEKSGELTEEDVKRLVKEFEAIEVTLPTVYGEPVQVNPDAVGLALANLTEEQAAIVLHPGGPALIDAIAGSGKSSVAARRLVALGLSGQDLSRTVFITFTNAAVADFSLKWHRISEQFKRQHGIVLARPNICTVHKLANEVVKATKGYRPANEDFFRILKDVASGKQLFADLSVPQSAEQLDDMADAELAALGQALSSIISDWQKQEPKEGGGSWPSKAKTFDRMADDLRSTGETKHRKFALGSIKFALRRYKWAFDKLRGAERTENPAPEDKEKPAGDFYEKVKDLNEAISYYTALLPGADVKEADAKIMDTEEELYGTEFIRPPLQSRDDANGVMAQRRSVSFSGMLEMAFMYLEEHPGHFMYDHIIYDEAQDTSPLMLSIAFRFAGVGRVAQPNIMLIGDAIGQSIYSFQAGRPELILGCAEAPTWRNYPLSMNWRCGSKIVEAASRLIVREEHAARTAKEGSVEIVPAPDTGGGVYNVVNEIEVLHGKGVAWKDIAILYRVRVHSALPQMELWRRHIPHYVERGEIFWEEDAMKVMVGYLRFLHKPDGMSFSRIYNNPMRFFPAGTMKVFDLVAKKANDDIYSYLDQDLWSDCAYQARVDKPNNFMRSVGRFVDDMESIYRDREHVNTAVAAIGRLEGADGNLITAPRARRGEDARWVDAWDYILAAASYMDTPVDEFLTMVEASIKEAREANEIAKMPPVLRERIDKVTLTTAHSSKGREWPYVFIVNFEQEVWPNRRAVRERGPEGEAEERRLAYVACTRAKDRLYVTCAAHKASPYVEALEGKTLAAPAKSAYSAAYARWVQAGCPAGAAPFVPRPKEVL